MARKVAYAARVGLDVTHETDPAEVDEALECHIGSADLVEAVWLRQATATADAVAQLEAPGGDGTGFLVSPWLLLTNNHVVSTPDDAAQTRVHFRYENAAGRITRHNPSGADSIEDYLADPDIAGPLGAAVDRLP